MLLSMSIASFWPRPQEEGRRQRDHHHHRSSNNNKSNKKFSSKPTESAASPPAQEEETRLVLFYKQQRYPILTLCMVVTCIGFAVVALIAANGWDGASITSNCYEDYLIHADCFCEKLYGSKPGDVWIAQPMNTITNLWFVLVGFWIASVADSNYQTCLLHIPNWVLLLPPPSPSPPSSTTDSHSSSSSSSNKKKNSKKNNLMTQDKLYATVLALVACLLGVGSTALHASFTNWGRQADMIAMYLLATYMILYPMLRSQLITKTGTVWSYLLSNSVLIYWVTQASTEPEQARTVFTTLIVLSIVVELQTTTTTSNDKSKKWIMANRKARRVHMALGLMFALSLGQWKLSSSGGPLCNPNSLWQGHSLWHFTSAIGIGMIFLYYLYEEPVLLHEDSNTTTTTTTTTTESSSSPNNENKDESQPPQVIRLVDNNNKKKTNTTVVSNVGGESASVLKNSNFEHRNSSSSNDTGTEEEEDDDNDVWSESSSSGK